MSRGAERIAGVPVRHVETGRGPLAYVELGSGPPVLLVPGFTGSKEDFGPILAPLAAAGHRAIAVDLRGQLDSPGAGDAASYGPAALAADLLAFVAALDLAPVHVVGHSYGGLVSRAAVLAAPETFASLTLLCSGPAAVSGTRALLMRRLRAQLLDGGIPRIVGLLAAAGDDAFDADRMAEHDATALLGMGDALLAEPDRVDELAKALAGAGIDALVACGADDDAWSPAVQQEMASRLGARFVSIAAAGHSPAIDQPAATAAVLAGFLA